MQPPARLRTLYHRLIGERYAAPLSDTTYNRLSAHGGRLTIVFFAICMATMLLPVFHTPLEPHAQTVSAGLFGVLALLFIPANMVLARSGNAALHEDGYTSPPHIHTTYVVITVASAFAAVFIALLGDTPLVVVAGVTLLFVFSVLAAMNTHEKCMNTLFEGVDADACVVRECEDGPLLFRSESHFEAYVADNGDETDESTASK